MPHQPPTGGPSADLIRVVTGYETSVGLVSSRPAASRMAGCYRLIGGCLLVPNTGDVIETWEELAAVPVAALADLKDAFEGLDEHSPDMGVDGRRIATVRAVLAYLPDA